MGGRGNYLDDAVDNLFFLSGVLAALDSPGEWFIDEKTWTLYVWMPECVREVKQGRESDGVAAAGSSERSVLVVNW